MAHTPKYLYLWMCVWQRGNVCMYICVRVRACMCVGACACVCISVYVSMYPCVRVPFWDCHGLSFLPFVSHYSDLFSLRNQSGNQMLWPLPFTLHLPTADTSLVIVFYLISIRTAEWGGRAEWSELAWMDSNLEETVGQSDPKSD